jgi:hypothetical protein
LPKALLAAVALVCVVALSSCSLLDSFGGRDPDVAAAEDRMAEIAAAVDDRDAAALKALFSPRAVERAPGLDAGIEYFLSLFPDGRLTWKLVGVSSEGVVDHGKKTWMVKPNYEVSSGGQDYRVVFADLTVNEVTDPGNVGLYALGAAPLPDDEALGYWNGFQHDTDGEYGYPGIYVPDDTIVYPGEQSDARMEEIAAAVNRQDEAALLGMFSDHARETVPGLDEEVRRLLANFPEGGLTWERDLINVSSALDDPERRKTKRLGPYYKVTAAGEDYWLFFADFVVNTTDPSSLGLAALAVTAWTEPGEPIPDTSFTAFAGSWAGVDAGENGIYVGS